MSKDTPTMEVTSCIIQEFISPERRKNAEEHKVYSLETEIIQKCAGSCAYCFANSTHVDDNMLSKEKIIEILEDGWERGARYVLWSGGDPLLHPDWYDLSLYAKDKGYMVCPVTASMISKTDAKRLVDMKADSVGIHIDTLHQETYNKIHTDPKTLEIKIRGYKNLLEAGYPPDQVFPMMTLTKPSISRVEETLDWFFDDMGAKHHCFLPLKPQGFGPRYLKEWEPSLSDVKRALEYRAKRLGQDWLKIGSMDVPKCFCRTNVVINPNGNVTPCALLSEMPVGNLHKERFGDIVDKNWQTLLFNFEVEGYCGTECENRELCFGCRSNAYHYTGNIKGSDPRCFMNPEAREHYFNN